MPKKRKPGDPGKQWDEAGVRYTVNPADDRRLSDPDAYYLNQKDLKTGNKATAVYRGDGRLADVPANRDWERVPKQGGSRPQRTASGRQSTSPAKPASSTANTAPRKLGPQPHTAELRFPLTVPLRE